jgi:uncharacterized protein (TIGR02118 family)
MVKLIALLKRKPELSKEAFAKRWLEEHVKLSSKMPGLLEYRINIANDYQADNAEPAFDGTAELRWESVEAMEAAFSSDIGKRAGQDADEFCEQRIHIYTEEHFVVKGKA